MKSTLCSARQIQPALLLFQCTAILALCLAMSIAAPAQTLKTIANFDSSDGEAPQSMALVQGIDGNFYGTAYLGGTFGAGTFFKVTPGGTITALYSFASSIFDASFPLAGVVLGKDGNFYGVSAGGGTSSKGTVFKMTSAGKETILHSFDGADGQTPTAPLIQASNGNFYGTTEAGGANSTGCGGTGCGTVFEITPSGTFTTLYNFCSLSNCADGAQVYAPLMQASNGNFYGTTFAGGAFNFGSIYEITAAGAFKTVYSFAGAPSDAANPEAGLIQASNGNFYGTTYAGGSDFVGTVYEMTPAGQVLILGSFNFADGVSAYAGVVQGADGNFYGTTYSGGANFQGNLYQATPSGTITNLYSFCSQSGCADGQYAQGGLVQSTNGMFYGVTVYGGAASEVCALGCGTVYSLSMGLKPFVSTLPGSGRVGQQIAILGNKLTGATAVAFNGTTATFTVKSGTLILATVPTGATTGTVKVTLPVGTLASNVPFRVLP